MKLPKKGAARLRDASKKALGRKRHIVVDTAGLLLAAVVHPADVPDRDGARLVLAELAGKLPRRRLIWADGAYRGALSEWVRERLGCRLEIVPRKAGRVVLRCCHGVGQWRGHWAGWVGSGV